MQPVVSTMNSDGRIKANAAIVSAGLGDVVDVDVANTAHVRSTSMLTSDRRAVRRCSSIR